MWLLSDESEGHYPQPRAKSPTSLAQATPVIATIAVMLAAERP